MKDENIPLKNEYHNLKQANTNTNEKETILQTNQERIKIE
jgi:hypothetical protein